MVTQHLLDNFSFSSILYPYDVPRAINVVAGEKSVDEYAQYINKHKLEQASIVMPNLRILELCPTLRYLQICPSYNAPEHFDASPLYDHPEVRMLNFTGEYGDARRFFAEIDYSRISGLVDLSFSQNKGARNYCCISTLRSLSVGGFHGKNRDLTDLFQSEDLDTLELRECRELSLHGIELAKKMQCVYLYYNRSLEDISSLYHVRKTIKALRICHCSKIKDFSVLGELENLELLELSGSNVLPDLNFLKNLKHLKTFEFDMNILDGDLTPCLEIPSVYCHRPRKHFNLRNEELPKGIYVHGNENIEEWRRTE